MRGCATFGVLLLLGIGSVAPSAAQPPAPARPDSARAERLYREALRLLDRNTFDSRRVALRNLEQATLLSPRTPLYELALARAYYRSGYLTSARLRYERVVRMVPDDADGRFGLGTVWRRDWLKYLDQASLARAVEHYRESARLRPERMEAWLALVPLLIERNDLAAAATAAGNALALDPGRPEALLAVASTAWRRGEVGAADSAFTRAIPRLQGGARAVFEDISPIASAADTFALRRLPPSERDEWVRRFWSKNDPDPASPENEARLEYWARVTQAYFLYFDTRRNEWDERGEVYVRYGPPQKADYNPVTKRLSVSFGTGPNFPANVLVWDYPELGMSVTMQDRLLSEYYLLPMSLSKEMDPVPDPDSLRRRDDSMPLAGGRGVFRKLPPGEKPLKMEGVIARFEGARGPRLLAQLATPAGPSDTLRAEWVVLDSSRLEVARGTRSLSPSACDAESLQVADFAAELAPGAYIVGLSVRDGRHGRGVFRREIVLDPAPAGLALSDVVVACGAPDVRPASPGEAPSVRIAANPAARVQAGAPLSAYFEIYHLRPAPSGLSRFEYLYTVRSAEKDKRIWLQRVFNPRATVPSISASREEDTPGSLRRQFVSVPVQTLPPGRYRLEIRVRDVIAGDEAAASAEFVRSAGERLRN